MKKTITKLLLISSLITCLNASGKYSNLSEDYLNFKINTDVKKVIATDPKTATKTLKILSHDYNKEVRLLAKKNLG